MQDAFCHQPADAGATGTAAGYGSEETTGSVDINSRRPGWLRVCRCLPDRLRLSNWQADSSLNGIAASFKGLLSAMFLGYSSDSGNQSLDALLSKGGMSSMLTTVGLIINAMAFGGAMARTGLLERLGRGGTKQSEVCRRPDHHHRRLLYWHQYSRRRPVSVGCYSRADVCQCLPQKETSS